MQANQEGLPMFVCSKGAGHCRLRRCVRIAEEREKPSARGYDSKEARGGGAAQSGGDREIREEVQATAEEEGQVRQLETVPREHGIQA